MANSGEFDAMLARGHALLRAGRSAEAERLLTAAVAAAPEHAGAHHLRGIALEQLGRVNEALAALLRCLTLAPATTGAALRAAELFFRHGDRRAAAKVLLDVAAAAANTDPVAANLCRARGLAAMEHHAEAAEALRAVLAIRPDHAEAWRLLGNMHSAGGALEPARAALRRATELDPHNASVLLDLVRAQRINEADRPLVARLEQELAGAEGSPRRQVLLGFALGKAYDDLGEPEHAMRAFDLANAIRARGALFDRTGHAAVIDRLIAAFPAREIAAVEPSRAVFIVGMPRSGTTLVEQILSSHPAVAAGGEQAFWGTQGGRWLSNGMPALDAALVRGEHARLLAQISPDAARVTDKNPFNFAWLGLIRRLLPGAYIIHCRRDPRDICLSCYMTMFTGGNAWATNRADLAFYYRAYERLMRHWRAVLPTERFIEIDYAAVVTAPEQAARRLVTFCDLAWNAACLRPETNTRAVHTASVYQAREAVHRRSLDRWRAYQPWLGELATLVG